MSTTIPQILANRQNAEHSTGPRTEDGKRAITLNALKHGLTGQTVVLPNEDKGRYAKFKEALFKDLAPHNTLEHMLAQTICDTQWRIERATAREANILALGHLEGHSEKIAELDNPEVRTAMIEVISSERHDRALKNVQLHEARLNRNLYKAMEELRALQATRKQADTDEWDAAVRAYNYHKGNGLPFKASDFGFVFTTAEVAQASIRQRFRKRR